MNTQTCKQCGKEFKVRSDKVKAGAGKFCSRKCVAQSQSTSVERFCKQCGTEFWVRPSQIEYGRGKFCSRGCFGKWQSENVRGPSHSQWKGGNVVRTCEQCGKEFEVYPSIARKGHGRFCSNSCKNQCQSDNIRGEYHPNWMGGKVSRICKQCGEIFEIYPSDIKSNSGKFCSKGCFGKWQSENRRGKHGANWHGGNITQICESCGEEFQVNRARLANARFCSMACRDAVLIGEGHWAWQGGISFEPYTSEFNDILKKQIRKRDNQICAICDERGRCIHHINYDKADNRPENLITLDRACHGKTNTNRECWEALLSPIAIARTRG